MIDYVSLVFFVSLISALVTLLVYRKINLSRKFAIGIDINKKDQRKVCESAGITLLLPIWISALYLISVNGLGSSVIYWVLLVSGFAAIGFIDDTRNKFTSKATPLFWRAIPVVVISLAFAYFHAPNILWVVPIAAYIILIASFENTFAGLNGWEVGSGLIISLFCCYLVSSSEVFWLCWILVGAILALFVLNSYPAKVFPGDSGTMLIGSGIATIAILRNNFEIMIILLLFFLPHFIDILLKLITNPRDVSQAKIKPYKLLDNGKLAIPDYKDGKTRYDFAKLLIRIFGPMKEWQIVTLVWIIVVLNCLAVLALFGRI